MAVCATLCTPPPSVPILPQPRPEFIRAEDVLSRGTPTVALLTTPNEASDLTAAPRVARTEGAPEPVEAFLLHWQEEVLGCNGKERAGKSALLGGLFCCRGKEAWRLRSGCSVMAFQKGLEPAAVKREEKESNREQNAH